LILNTTQLYIKGWFLWFFCAISVFTIQAQNNFLASDFSRRNMLDEPTAFKKEITNNPPTNTPTKTLNNTANIVKPYLFEEQFIGHPTASFVIKYDNKPIEWQYYSQNPLNIDNSENPFSLPIYTEQATKQTPKSSNLEYFSKTWAEVTALGNPNGSTDTPTWMALAFFGILGFVAAQLTLHRTELFNTFQAFASATAAGQSFREDKNFFSPATLFANATYGLTMGTFLFLAAQHFGDAQQFNTFSAWLICVMGSLGLYLSKHLQVWAFSHWLPAQTEFNFYNFTITNTNKVVGIALLPLVLCLAYAPEAAQEILFYTSFALLTSVYGYRSVRAASTALDCIISNSFHFLIYVLCIEIAPILIGLKMLSII
jgi:Domain of unknown function (DUF4271)